jgi:hypothetical protein
LEGLENRMETPQGKHLVTLEWNIGGEGKGRLPPGSDVIDIYGDESQKAQKVKICRKTTLLLSDGGIYRRLRESHLFKN